MENLPEAWDAADLGRATKGAAKALLGKAYMQQHKYDRAKEQLQWLIDRKALCMVCLITVKTILPI